MLKKELLDRVQFVESFRDNARNDGDGVYESYLSGVIHGLRHVIDLLDLEEHECLGPGCDVCDPDGTAF